MLRGGTELRGAMERGGVTEGMEREGGKRRKYERRGKIRREEWRGEKREETLQDPPTISEAAPSACRHRPLPERSVRAAAQLRAGFGTSLGSVPARLEPT